MDLVIAFQDPASSSVEEFAHGENDMLVAFGWYNQAAK